MTSSLPPASRPESRLGPLPIGADHPMVLVAGPCVIESREHTLSLAAAIRDIAAGAKVPFIFKASFDKANRSSLASYRGPGMAEGLDILACVKREVGVPVLSDIHLPDQAEPAGRVLDVLQIPAFLARQTDLLIAAAVQHNVSERLRQLLPRRVFALVIVAA